jgi:hypothetical protein
VTRVVILRKGRSSQARRQIEHSRGFRRQIKWRTCSEGRISHLQHRFGWDRSLLDGLPAQPPGAASGYSPTTPTKISQAVETRAAVRAPDAGHSGQRATRAPEHRHRRSLRPSPLSGPFGLPAKGPSQAGESPKREPGRTKERGREPTRSRSLRLHRLHYPFGGT